MPFLVQKIHNRKCTCHDGREMHYSSKGADMECLIKSNTSL